MPDYRTGIGGTESSAARAHPRRPRAPAWTAAIVLLAAASLLFTPHLDASGRDGAQGGDRPRFRAGVSRVNVAVTVRDRQGRLVTGLNSRDFVVIDSAGEKPVTDFEVRQGGITVAAVLDASGSMAIGGRLRLAARALETLFAGLGDADEAALFAFDSSLREIHGFTTDRGALQHALGGIRPFGSTSLHDAIAEAARAVTGRRDRRAAVLIVTDGIDTSSALTPVEASGIASSVDVPIYVIGLNPSATPAPERRCAGGADGQDELPCLARWTGGAFDLAHGPEDAQDAIHRMVAELRHQYMIAFEPTSEPGWHPIEIRARGDRLLTRTRSWYWVGRNSPGD